jgi:hypothetical protein
MFLRKYIVIYGGLLLFYLLKNSSIMPFIIDDLFKYTWIIPLQNIFDFLTVYLSFQKYVSSQFNK